LIHSPASGQVISGTESAITGTAYSAFAAQHVELSLNGGTDWITTTGTTTWHYTWTLPAEDGVEHTLLVRSVGSLNRVEVPGPGVTVTVDTIAPASVITNPVSGLVISETTFTLYGTAADGLGVRRVEVSLDGGTTWQVASSAEIWSYTWQVPDEENVEHVLLSRATDLAGNVESPSTGVTVTVRTRYSIPLQPGWNLIALPLAPSDPAPAAVLASIADGYDLVYTYEACDDASDPWNRYDPAAPPQVNDLTAMDVRHGYWLRATQAVTLTVRGAPPVSTAISLCTGWNLVGYPSTTAIALPAALAGIAGKYDLVYAYVAGDPDPWKRFDPLAPPQVNDLTAMGPARGYWIRATAPAVLNVP
jgi:hypothetical protein